MKTAFKSILLLVNLSRASGRDFLSGIMHALNAQGDWRIRILQVQEHSPEELRILLETARPDGIISAEMEIPEVATALEHATTPLVVVGTRRTCIPKRTRNITFVSYDEDFIGKLGAEHLLSLGRFASYGFVHYTEKPYAHLSFLRKRGFRRRLIAAGLDCTTFGEPGEEEDIDREKLERWLVALPKPAALLVSCDKRTVEVVAACNRRRLEIPSDIAILGIDNDELLCRSTRPALSSISTTISRVGEVSVAELSRLFRHPAQKPRNIRINPGAHVIRRDSCVPLAPGLALTDRALRFIHENANRKLTVREVVRYLGVSRRLADLRFREFRNQTILDAITEARLGEVKRLLAASDERIGQIAFKCGFSNPNYLKILFKRHVGSSMRDYRKSLSSVSREIAPDSP